MNIVYSIAILDIIITLKNLAWLGILQKLSLARKEVATKKERKQKTHSLLCVIVENADYLYDFT